MSLKFALQWLETSTVFIPDSIQPEQRKQEPPVSRHMEKYAGIRWARNKKPPKT